MRVFAYCTLTAVDAVRRATGVEPHTSPPYTPETIWPELLAGYDLLYFRLHGMPAFPGWWFGEDRGGAHLALTASKVPDLHLAGATVVIGSCYGDESEFVKAFKAAGAAAVIAGGGTNYAWAKRVAGTDKLVQGIIRHMERGDDAKAALARAKRSMVATAWRRADRDAMRFRIVGGEK